VKRTELLNYIHEYLRVGDYSDYCVNGLQVEGCDEINRIVTGVSVSDRLFSYAAEKKADAVIVHHGLFWKGGTPHPFSLRGVMRQRVKTLLDADLNLLAYHLPLDAHPEVGNGIQLANGLGLTKTEPLDYGVTGVFETPQTIAQIEQRLKATCPGEPAIFAYGPEKNERVAVLTGGAASMAEAVAEAGMQVFITGNATEPCVRIAEEAGINLIAAGHYNSERLGAMALGEHLKAEFSLAVDFFEVPNPV
jgi:dinuclear metal center YbgI/SA1388 family protein